MTNEGLNKRLRFFSEHGLPYSEKVWLLLKQTWNDGFDAGVGAAVRKEEGDKRNPYAE